MSELPDSEPPKRGTISRGGAKRKVIFAQEELDLVDKKLKEFHDTLKSTATGFARLEGCDYVQAKHIHHACSSICQTPHENGLTRYEWMSSSIALTVGGLLVWVSSAISGCSEFLISVDGVAKGQIAITNAQFWYLGTLFAGSALILFASAYAVIRSYWPELLAKWNRKSRASD